MKADLTRLRELWNRTCDFDQLSDEVFTEKITGDSDYDPELLLIRERNNHPIAFCHGVLRKRDESATGYVKMIAVDREYQGQGIGSEILGKLEKALGTRGAEKVRIAESAPNYLVPGIDPRYTRAMVFFKRKGYDRFGETWNLGVDLNDLKDPVTKSDDRTIVRRSRAEDRDSVIEFLQESWPAWIAEVSVTFRNDPISLHIAIQDDSLVAFSAYDTNNPGTGWFGPMGTVEAARGRGLGAVLLWHCLQDIRSQGLNRAIIPWVGPIGFYHRHVNAVVDRVFYRYEKILSP